MRAVAAAVVGVALALIAWPAAASGQNYRIPADNPFVGQAGAAPEVYALGLRNPFRFSFDRQTGDLLIGDVGGGEREEIDWISRAAARGANFGWPCREGKIAGPVGPPDPRCPSPPPSYVEPLFEYETNGAAIVAGYVVRDPALTGLFGRALYADHFDGDIRSVALDPAAPGDMSTGQVHTRLSSFGEDAAGRLYVADLVDNAVLRLTAGPMSGTLSSTSLPGPWDQPIAIATVPGDASRLLVGERGGDVHLVVNGEAQEPPIAQVSTTTDSERGLLSVVAAPDFATTGRLFVYYTDQGGDVRVDEFTGPTRREILTIEHSSAGNHNGGQLHFGPDGCLWITTGDGGGSDGHLQNPQNPGTLLGKLLRIDPNLTGPLCGGSAPVAPGATAALPTDRAPELAVGIRRRQRVLRRRGVLVSVGCSEPCRVAAGGRLRIGKARYRMRRIVQRAPDRGMRRIKVRLTKRGFRALQRCARRGRLRRASVRLTLRAMDSAGLRSPAVRPTVRVRR